MEDNILEEKDMITIHDENGKEKEVEVIHYFTLDSNGLDYIVYTDNKEDENGNVLVYTSEVVSKDDIVELRGIEDKNVIEEITAILTEIIQN